MFINEFDDFSIKCRYSNILLKNHQLHFSSKKFWQSKLWIFIGMDPDATVLFFSGQFWLIQWSCYIHSTTPYLYPRFALCMSRSFLIVTVSSHQEDSKSKATTSLFLNAERFKLSKQENKC